MTQEEYNQLRSEGMGGVVTHYGRLLLKGDITKEQYDKIIKFWKDEFRKKPKIITQKDDEKATLNESISDDSQAEDALERLIDDCGKRGIELCDTKQDIIEK